MIKPSPITIQEIHYKGIEKAGITLSMARADKVHVSASGNKIYKLRPILEYAKTNNFKQILSFGGAYSNHIHALALLAQEYGMESIGLIRGEAEYANNPTLSDVQKAGMRLEFLNRESYKQRNEAWYLDDLQQRYPKALIVPEGGSSQLAVKGCAQMARDIANFRNDNSQTTLAIASGTGATAAGLACGLSEYQKLNVYSVLKDESLQSRIDGFICEEQVTAEYSLYPADFGGYAKFDHSLLAFILDWLEQTGILLDPIYTSKMCRCAVQQIEAGIFTSGQSLTLIHSGGLQGWRGMEQRVENLGGRSAWNQIDDYLKNEVPI